MDKKIFNIDNIYFRLSVHCKILKGMLITVDYSLYFIGFFITNLCNLWSIFTLE